MVQLIKCLLLGHTDLSSTPGTQEDFASLGPGKQGLEDSLDLLFN